MQHLGLDDDDDDDDDKKMVMLISMMVVVVMAILLMIYRQFLTQIHLLHCISAYTALQLGLFIFCSDCHYYHDITILLLFLLLLPVFSFVIVIVTFSFVVTCMHNIFDEDFLLLS